MSAFKEILAKRRDRMIATILGFKEDELDIYVPDDVGQEFRKLILDQINDYYDLCIDVVRSAENGSVMFNETYLERIENAIGEIREAVV